LILQHSNRYVGGRGLGVATLRIELWVFNGSNCINWCSVKLIISP
jgi:hypothetical protein